MYAKALKCFSLRATIVSPWTKAVPAIRRCACAAALRYPRDDADGVRDAGGLDHQGRAQRS
jgi:hypothetical protein